MGKSSSKEFQEELWSQASEANISNFNIEEFLQKLSKPDNTEFVEMLKSVRSPKGHNFLCYIVSYPDTTGEPRRKIVEALMEHKIFDIDEQCVPDDKSSSLTALMIACTIPGGENADLVADLLVNGADPNVVSNSDYKYDETRKQTALHHAASSRFPSAVAELCAVKGINVNARDHEGRTPLHLAAWCGEAKSCEILVAAGADINAKTNSGQAVIWFASLYLHRSPDVVKFLIQSGCDIASTWGPLRSEVNSTPEWNPTDKTLKSYFLESKPMNKEKFGPLIGKGTKLHDAVIIGATRVIELLVDQGYSKDAVLVDDKGNEYTVEDLLQIRYEMK